MRIEDEAKRGSRVVPVVGWVWTVCRGLWVERRERRERRRLREERAWRRRRWERRKR